MAIFIYLESGKACMGFITVKEADTPDLYTPVSKCLYIKCDYSQIAKNQKRVVFGGKVGQNKAISALD